MEIKKIKLSILGLSYSQTQSGAYALVLAEEDGERRIPIIIGGVEAQSIAIKLEGLEPPRPLTHDLFLSFAKSFSIELKEVLIYRLEEGIFFSELVCQKGDEIIRIDSRTSDAVAIALRFNAPIYIDEAIMKKAGIVLYFDDKKKEEPGEKKEDIKSSKTSKADEFSAKSMEELSNLLHDAIESENYEVASKIRDEIQRRQK